MATVKYNLVILKIQILETYIKNFCILSKERY